jgi:hypothetical protein
VTSFLLIDCVLLLAAKANTCMMAPKMNKIKNGETFAQQSKNLLCCDSAKYVRETRTYFR